MKPSKPKQKKIKAWACVLTGHGTSYIPQVGNGNQWQLPIFATKKEAKEFKAEPNGLTEAQIIPVTISYTL